MKEEVCEHTVINKKETYQWRRIWPTGINYNIAEHNAFLEIQKSVFAPTATATDQIKVAKAYKSERSFSAVKCAWNNLLKYENKKQRKSQNSFKWKRIFKQSMMLAEVRTSMKKLREGPRRSRHFQHSQYNYQGDRFWKAKNPSTKIRLC